MTSSLLLAILAASAQASVVEEKRIAAGAPAVSTVGAVNVKPKVDLNTLISHSDYPNLALRRSEQGTVKVRLTIDAGGSTTGCEVLSSSGSKSLDETTCRLLRQKAKFEPARDADGNPAISTVEYSHKWRL
jgi:periplasmic protein TonB